VFLECQQILETKYGGFRHELGSDY